MKNFISNPLRALLMLGISLSASVSSHAQETPTEATPQTPLAATDSSDVFDWKLQPPVGLRGRYVIFTRTQLSQNIPAMPARSGRAKTFAQRIEVQSQQSVEVDYETISRDSQGGTVSRLTYRTLKHKSSQKMNGRPMAVPRSAQLEQLEKMFDDVEIDIKQGPDGRVWSVQGLDAMRRRLNRVLGTDAATRAMMKPFFDSVFSEKTLRQSWDFSALQPKTSVRVGDIWNYKIPLDMAGMTIEMRGVRTLSALNPNRATVGDRGNISMQMNSAFKFPSTMKNPPKISMVGGGTTTGATIVDRATGLQIETHSNQRWTMKTSIKTVEEGRVVSMETPQWIVVQTRQVFRPQE